MGTIPSVVALVFMLGLHGTSHAAESLGDPAPALHGAHRPPSDEAAILQAVQGFAVGFIQRDLDLIMQLWDASTAHEASFIQVENGVPVIGLHNFRAYYANHLQQIITLDGNVSEVHIQRMGNLAIVSCRYIWVSKYVSTGYVSIDTTRASIVLRKQGHRWLYLHFHESITYS